MVLFCLIVSCFIMFGCMSLAGLFFSEGKLRSSISGGERKWGKAGRNGRRGNSSQDAVYESRIF